MKVTLDLAHLLATGQISPAEADRFKQLGLVSRPAGSTAFNLIIGFGVLAVSGGLIALLLDPYAITGLGAITLFIGLFLYATRGREWELLGHICVIIGVIELSTGIVVISEGSVLVLFGIAIVYAAAGLFAESSLLIVFAMLAFMSGVGAQAGSLDPTNFLGIAEPTTNIIVFTIVGLLTFFASLRLREPYSRLALTAARMSVLIVNFAFWLGSVFGDELSSYDTEFRGEVFAVVWAVLLLGVGAWGVIVGRRWVANTAAVFGIIHFYSQWFTRLDASAESVLLAGVIALAFGFALYWFNRRLFTGRTGPLPYPRP